MVPDGVTVPPELAGPLVRLATIGAAELSRRDGLPLAPGLGRLLRELGGFARETAPVIVEPTLSAGLRSAEAAALCGMSAQMVRRLCVSRRLIARKQDGRWEIDRQSAEDYAKGRRQGGPW